MIIIDNIISNGIKRKHKFPPNITQDDIENLKDIIENYLDNISSKLTVKFGQNFYINEKETATQNVFLIDCGLNYKALVNIDTGRLYSPPKLIIKDDLFTISEILSLIGDADKLKNIKITIQLPSFESHLYYTGENYER